MTSAVEVLKQFQNVTGADADTGKFYLESSGWDLSVRAPGEDLLFCLGGTWLLVGRTYVRNPSWWVVLLLRRPPQRCSSRAVDRLCRPRPVLPQSTRPVQGSPDHRLHPDPSGGKGESGLSLFEAARLSDCSVVVCVGRGGVRGFSDLASRQDEPAQDYYTGGKSSGMVVQDPQGRPSGSPADLVSELMENARRY